MLIEKLIKDATELEQLQELPCHNKNRDHKVIINLAIQLKLGCEEYLRSPEERVVEQIRQVNRLHDHCISSIAISRAILKARKTKRLVILGIIAVAVLAYGGWVVSSMWSTLI